MLTSVQLKQIEELKAEFLLAANTELLEPAKVRRLLLGCAELAELVKHLSTSRPEEYAFPAHAGLLNDLNCIGYVMRQHVRATIEQKVRIDGADRMAVLSHLVSCQPTDALMVVRPYVRIAGMISDAIVERLSEARLSLAIDGDLLIDRGLLRDHLADAQGYGFRGETFSFRNLMPRAGGQSFFRAGEVSSAHTGVGMTVIPLSHQNIGWQIDGDREIGFFIAHGTTLTVDLEDLKGFENDPVTLTVGVVACQYSTKSDHFLPKRKQDWSPRDPI